MNRGEAMKSDHVIKCTCAGTCTMALVTHWGADDTAPDDEWYVEFYESAQQASRFRDRLRIAWSTIRGRDAWRHELCLDDEGTVGLRDWLNEQTERVSPVGSAHADKATIRHLRQLLTEVSDALRDAIGYLPPGPERQQLAAAIDFNPPRNWNKFEQEAEHGS